jgi:hypothetical protein
VPRIQLNEMHRTGDGSEKFPDVKLDTGEICRMLLPEDDAWCEWVHDVRAPVIGEDGHAVMVTKQRKDKTSYTDYDYRFIARRICLGDPIVLDDKGVDENRCPACAAALRGTRDMRPTRRFAVPVIRITTKNIRSTEPRNPAGAEILIWKLTAKQYDLLLGVRSQIIDLLQLTEADEFHWRRADIVIQCEDGGWQRNTFKPPMRPAYASDKALGDLIRELWIDVSNRPTGDQLRDACGRAPDRAYMVQEVTDCETAWRQVANVGSSTQTDPVGTAPMGGAGKQEQDLTASLETLFSESTPAAAAGTPDGPPAADPFEQQITAELASHPGGLAEFGPRSETAAPAGSQAVGDPFAASAEVAPQPAQPQAAPADEAKPASFDTIMQGF